MVVAAGIEMFAMMDKTNELQDKLHRNTDYFREKMLAAGFDIKPTQSAICAVMLYDAKLSQEFSAKLQDEGIYVTGFYYPVVPKGQARIRVQISAANGVTVAVAANGATAKVVVASIAAAVVATTVVAVEVVTGTTIAVVAVVTTTTVATTAAAATKHQLLTR
jgi:hypothetical protein